MVRKVLVQWLPAPALRSILALELGPRGSNEVQQWPIAADHPMFADFFARVNRWLDGLAIVQIGFDLPLRASDTGWKLQGTAPPEAQWLSKPSLEDLLDMDLRLMSSRPNDPAVTEAIRSKVQSILLDERTRAARAAEEYQASLDRTNAHPGEVQTVVVGQRPEPVVEKAMEYTGSAKDLLP